MLGAPSAGTPDASSPDYTYVGVIFNSWKTVWTRYLIPGNQHRDKSGHFVDNSVGRHQREDVDPYVACSKAGMNEVYFKYRPPNQGANLPDGSPCPKTTIPGDTYVGH